MARFPDLCPCCCSGGPCAAAAFIPTLEKFGKSAQVLVSPEQVSFVQTPLEADGAQVCVTFKAVSVLLLLAVC
jgi:hypothetical protein